MPQQMECKRSSNLQWARYFPEEERLEIDFKTSTGSFASTYEYRSFQAMDWDLFVEADSKGKHFAYHIRGAKDSQGKPKFPATRIK
jgi:hypothetical protein